jgi:hypothetical protein
MVVYLVNNSGIHTTQKHLVAVYKEISPEKFDYFIITYKDILVSSLGHQTIVDYLNQRFKSHWNLHFEYNRATNDYKEGDILIGLKPNVRLPETHDFDSNFLANMYKYYLIYFLTISPVPKFKDFLEICNNE